MNENGKKKKCTCWFAHKNISKISYTWIENNNVRYFMLVVIYVSLYFETSKPNVSTRQPWGKTFSPTAKSLFNKHNCTLFRAFTVLLATQFQVTTTSPQLNANWKVAFSMLRRKNIGKLAWWFHCDTA